MIEHDDSASKTYQVTADNGGVYLCNGRFIKLRISKVKKKKRVTIAPTMGGSLGGSGGQAWGRVCVLESCMNAWSTDCYMGPQWGSLVTVRAAVETYQYERAMKGALCGTGWVRALWDWLGADL